MIQFLNNNLAVLVMFSCFVGFMACLVVIIAMDMHNRSSQYTDCLERSMQYISGNCVK